MLADVCMHGLYVQNGAKNGSEDVSIHAGAIPSYLPSYIGIVVIHFQIYENISKEGALYLPLYF